MKPRTEMTVNGVRTGQLEISGRSLLSEIQVSVDGEPYSYGLVDGSGTLKFNINKGEHYDPDSIKVLSGLEKYKHNGQKTYSSDQIEDLTKKVTLANGMSLFDEIVIQVCSSISGGNLNEYRKIVKKELPEPYGFINLLLEAKKTITFKSGQSIFLDMITDLKDISRKMARVRELNLDIDIVDTTTRLFKADSIIRKISASYNQNIGDLFGSLIESVALNKPIDLLFFKCPRMVQYVDERGQNRLDVIPHSKDEERQSRDGRRKYKGDEKLVAYFTELQKLFKNIGLESTFTIIVMEDDVENMFPIHSKLLITNSSYDYLIVPESDVLSAKEKARQYSQDLDHILKTKLTGSSSCVLGDLAASTYFYRVKDRVFDDIVRSKFDVTRSKEVDEYVSDDLERYSRVYPNYRREHAKYKIANKIADMRASFVLFELFNNPILLTRGPLPIKQAHLLSGIQVSKKDRKIIFCDPERDNL